MNRISFSVVPSVNPSAVVIVNYEAVRQEEKGLVCVLSSMQFNMTSPRQFREASCREVPVMIGYAKGKLPKQFGDWQKAGCHVKDISSYDTSFENFWTLYGHKVGNKKLVGKKWENMAWEDQIMAIGSIPRIKRYYQEKGYDLPYPETYINQRRWENEF